MLFFVFFLMFFVSFINYCIVDYVVWWSIFIICTFIFVFFVGLSKVSSTVNYYVVQEVTGYYFLVFNNWKMQLMVLMVKSGTAPMHFWLFSALSNLKKWFILWFLTLQKLPYLFVLVSFCSDFFFIFIFIGMVLCYLHVLFLRSYFELVVIVSTESFSWLLLFGMFFNDVHIFFFFYYLIMFFIISYVYNYFFNFIGIGMVFVFFNVSFSISFFLKVFLLFGSSDLIGLYYIFLLFSMCLLSLGVSYFFFVIMMVNVYGVKYHDYFIFVLCCVGFLSVF